MFSFLRKLIRFSFSGNCILCARMSDNARTTGEHERLRDELQCNLFAHLRHRRFGQNENLFQRMRHEIGELSEQIKCVFLFICAVFYLLTL